jgi:hypothetical protein
VLPALIIPRLQLIRFQEDVGYFDKQLVRLLSYCANETRQCHISVDSNHTGHSFVNATGLESSIQQWLNVIFHAEGGVRYGAGGVAQGNNLSLVLTSGAGTTRLLYNESTDGLKRLPYFQKQ